MPLVSIVIPAYHAERFIDAALESARAQTHQQIEIIVVDDASQDKTSERVSSHVANDPRVRLITLPKNQGQCAACNHGLRAARGEYVKFFDADDILSPEAVAIQVMALANDPEHLAYGEWARFHIDTSEATFTPRAGWRDAQPVDWLVEIWNDGHPMMQCAQFLIPRILLDRTGGWDERLSLINDFEFFSRLVIASKGVIFTPGARLFYRSGLQDSLSASRNAKAWESAYQSAMLGTAHLLVAEESQRTRRASANILQSLTYDMYPHTLDLVVKLEVRIAELGGSNILPQGGNSFAWIRRLVGWKMARRLQILTGKYPK